MNGVRGSMTTGESGLGLAGVTRRSALGTLALAGAGAGFMTLSGFLGTGCSKNPTSPGGTSIATTVSMVTDLVKQIAGDRVGVRGLMGPGVDPHLYKPTAGDVVALQQAGLTFYSGLHLEGKMQDVFEQIQRGGRRIRAITDSIPRDRLLKPVGFEGQYDPHVWFDVELWAFCIASVLEELVAARPEDRAYFEANAAVARKAFADLHAWALSKSGELPPAKRVLVTSHDAYNYFGRAYGFKVVALQGISTVTEASLSDLTRLVDFIRAQGIKAIFVESSVPHTTIERISRDAGVRVGGELFSDAMGNPGQMENGVDVGTYEGMIRHNLTTLVEALK